MSLSIETRRQSARETVIALSGEVDYATAQNLRAAISAILMRRAADAIVVDLAGVTLVDSTGLGTMVVARRICDEFDVEFRVRDPNPFVAKLFTVVGVADVLGLLPVLGLPPRVPVERGERMAPRVA